LCSSQDYADDGRDYDKVKEVHTHIHNVTQRKRKKREAREPERVEKGSHPNTHTETHTTRTPAQVCDAWESGDNNAVAVWYVTHTTQPRKFWG
jgi:hypothetical protein